MKKGKLEKAFDHMRAKYKPKPKKSFYLWGRKKGIDLIASDEYREGWDRIFGKRDDPQEFDNGK